MNKHITLRAEYQDGKAAHLEATAMDTEARFYGESRIAVVRLAGGEKPFHIYELHRHLTWHDFIVEIEKEARIKDAYLAIDG